MKKNKEKKEQECLLEKAMKELIERIGEERARNYPLYISCPCPKCTPIF